MPELPPGWIKVRSVHLLRDGSGLAGYRPLDGPKSVAPCEYFKVYFNGELRTDAVSARARQDNKFEGWGDLSFLSDLNRRQVFKTYGKVELHFDAEGAKDWQKTLTPAMLEERRQAYRRYKGWLPKGHREKTAEEKREQKKQEEHLRESTVDWLLGSMFPDKRP